MRVFLDINVLVSAFGTRGLCTDVVRIVLAEHDLVIAEVVFDELRRVLAGKFGLPERHIDEVEILLRRYEVVQSGYAIPDIPLKDDDDLAVLGAALAGHVDVLVTGDKELLEVRDEVSQLRILNPREFWSAVRK